MASSAGSRRPGRRIVEAGGEGKLNVAIAIQSTPSVAEPSTRHLAVALRHLAAVARVARDEDYPEPSALARDHAERLLRAMYQILPCRYEIYPTMDGEIALDAFSRNGRSVIVLCESDGGASCLVNMKGHQHSEHLEDAARLPNRFLRQALAELARHLD